MARHGKTRSRPSGQRDTEAERTPLLSSPMTESQPQHEGSKTTPSGGREQSAKNGYMTPTVKHQISTIRIYVCALALGVLIFLQATNISMLTTTQSEIAGDLDAFDKASWLTSSYLIAMASLTPLNGKLASIFPLRYCIFASSVLLATGVGICGAAPSFEAFIVGRVITGIGGGGIFTVGIIIVLELSGAKSRGLSIGLFNSGYTFGVAVGATAAGAMLPHLGWRALFWMQAPAAFVSGAVLLFAIPLDLVPTNKEMTEESPLRRLARIDYLGATTLTASIVLVLYALSSPQSIPILPIVLGSLVLVTFVLVEVHLASDPIIPITLLKSRGLLLTCLGTVGYMMARWSVLFFTPMYALAVRQWSPATAGSMLIPTNGGFAIGGMLVGWLHIRRHGSFYVPTLVVYALFPITLIGMAVLAKEYSNAIAFVVVVFINGFLTGAALNYNLAHLLHLTPHSTHYVATALTATFRGFAGSFGAAVGGGIFTRTLSTSLEMHFQDRELFDRGRLVHELLGSPATVRKLSGLEREAAILGYQDALRTLWYAAAGLAFMMIFVQAGTGWADATEEGGSRLEEEQSALLQREESGGDSQERV